MAQPSAKRHWLVLPLLSLIAVALLLLWQLRVLITTGEWADRADKALVSAYNIERQIIELESGVRGYAITGDVVFLEPFSQSLGTLPRTFRSFEEWTRDDVSQISRMAEVRELLNRWMGFANQAISQREAGRDVTGLLKTGRGKKIMDSIRAKMSVIVKEEERIKENRLASARSAAQRVFGSAVIGFILIGLYLSRNLTLRGRWEKALRLREEQLDAFFADSPAGMVLLDRDFRYLKINQLLADTNGLPIEDHLGRTVPEVLPLLAPSLMPIFRKILRTGEPALNLPVSGMTQKDPGRMLHWMVSYFPIRNPSGEVDYIGGVVVEVTALRQAEQAIRESEQRFRQLAENIPEVFWLTDWPENKVVYVSPAFEHIWGRRADDLLRNPMLWVDAIVEEERARVEEAFHEIERKSGYDVTYQIRRPDREVRWIHDRAFLVRDQDGKAVRIAGIAVDITERKKTEEVLRKQAESLKLYAEEVYDLYNNAPCGYHSLGPDGTFIQINDTELRWLGYDRGELIGRKKFSDIVTSESRKLFQANFPGFMARGYVSDLKFDLFRKDGSILPVIVSATALRDPDGNYRMSRSIVFDYTTQKRLENELQEALRARDEFLSIASHDLKTPLTALALQIELLQKKPLPGVLRKARDQVERVTRLVDDLLDLTRIRVGKFVLNPTRVDLTQVVKEVVEHFAVETVGRGIPIRVHAEAPVIGDWDPLRVDQIVTNLISNAVKYGKGQPVDVWIEKKEGRGLAQLRVVDRGMGIPMALQKRVFERFERATEAKEIKGLGLGLYITRQIAEAHHGSIEVLSEEEKGSTFILELPLAA